MLQHYNPGEPNNGKYSVRQIVTFEIEGANLENDIASEKRLTESKRLHQNPNDLGVILLEKEFNTQ